MSVLLQYLAEVQRGVVEAGAVAGLRCQRPPDPASPASQCVCIACIPPMHPMHLTRREGG